MPMILSKEETYEHARRWMEIRRIAKGKQMFIFQTILHPFLKYLERNGIYFYSEKH